MGYDKEKFPKRLFSSLKNPNLSPKMKKFLIQNRNELIENELFAFNKTEFLGSIQNEFTNKYKHIYSLYLENEKIELTNSTTKIDKVFHIADLIIDRYEDDLGFIINFSWAPLENGRRMEFSIVTDLLQIKWNFRKLESPVSRDFLPYQNESVTQNLLWNSDYCIDILTFSGKVVTIWICLREYFT